MKMKKLALIFLCSKALFAGDLFVNYEGANHLLAEAEHYEAFHKICDEENLFEVDIKWVKSNRQAINDQINKEIGSADELKASLAEIMKESVAGYEEQIKSDSQNTEKFIWCAREYNIIPQYFGHYKNIEQFEVLYYEFLGGAHGMYSTQYLLFNDKNERVTLDKIIQAEKKEALYDLVLKAYLKYSEVSSVEEYFKKEIYLSFDANQEGQSADKTLREALVLDNFYFDENGLNFSYSPYALAPYSEGEVILTLPYADLKDILLSEYQ